MHIPTSTHGQSNASYLGHQYCRKRSIDSGHSSESTAGVRLRADVIVDLEVYQVVNAS